MNEYDALKQARLKLEEQNEFIKGLSNDALVVGTVVDLTKDRVLVHESGTLISCVRPMFGPERKVSLGCSVLLTEQTKQIIGIIDTPTNGEVCKIVRAISDKSCIIEHEGTKRVATLADNISVEDGDNVIMDERFFVIIKNLGKFQENVYSEISNVSWDDIGGLTQAKEAIREAIEYPIRYSELYKAYNKKPAKGVLLYGPPGCGKTMLGKATATALQNYHGQSNDGGFLYVKGPELLNKYVGETEERIRDLFSQAKKYKEKTGHAAVLFIDEADAILASRRTRAMSQTVVPMFLAEMDGLSDSSAFVMLSTNTPDALDSAITRDGRIDRKIEVHRPNRENVAEILDISLRNRPLQDSDNLKELTLDLIFSDNVIVKGSVLLRDVLSGAIIAGIVNRATEIAIRRDREQNSNVTGICIEDIRQAIEMTAHEMKDIDLSEAKITTQLALN